ncbi:MAG: hypothetical protein RLZZ432_27 [Chloroflexota bacterium]
MSDRTTALLRRPPRFVATALAALLVFGGLGVRLVALQLGDGGSGGGRVGMLPNGHRIVEQQIAPSRGLIVDRAGRVVAKNVATYSVQIRPGDLPLTIRAGVLAELGAILQIDPVRLTMILDRATGSMWDPVRVANNVDEAAARLIAEEAAALPGVETLIEPRRVYPYGRLISAVVGYVGRIDAAEASALAGDGYTSTDFIGRTGVEASYETALRGTPGVRQLEVDARGRIVRDLGVVKAATPGKTVVLTIDLDAQRQATDALEWGLKPAKRKHGVVVAMNPKNGQMIALVTLPTYDNNDFAGGISNAQYSAYLNAPYSPLINAALGEQNAPGSTYKLVTYSCALQHRLVRPDEKLDTTAYLEVDGEKFYEWNKKGFRNGPMRPDVAFSYSSAVVTYRLTRRIQVDRLVGCGKAWGFGTPTGIDLPGEIGGVVPSNEWARATINRGLYNGEVLQSALGQGFDLVTPLQVLRAFAALANSGTLWEPRVVLELRSADGKTVEPIAPVKAGDVGMREDVYAYMRNAARLVMLNKNMRAYAGNMPIYIAGKTGTAEYGLRDRNNRLSYHNWLAGFISPSGDWAKADAEFAYASFMFGANTVGNSAVEVSKKFVQEYFDLPGDYAIARFIRYGYYVGE